MGASRESNETANQLLCLLNEPLTLMPIPSVAVMRSRHRVLFILVRLFWFVYSVSDIGQATLTLTLTLPVIETYQIFRFLVNDFRYGSLS